MLNTDILNINPETVCFIITKAKEFHAKEEVTFSEPIPDSEYEYDWSQILADHADDLSYLEVSKAIENLDPDQQTDLLTLMYIGRGDFEASEWSNAYKEARNNLLPNLTDYLFSKPLIAYYLEKALELLEYSCDK